MALPLLSGWMICGDALPERLRAFEPAAQAFTLPGADALAGFADLLGTQDESPSPIGPETPDPGAPFALPALIPDDAPGSIALSREISFAGLKAQRAWLCFDMLCGSGEVTLSPCPPRFAQPAAPGTEPPILHASFCSAPLTLDVTEALRTRRRFRLSLRFDDARPAGVCGAILLRTAAHAMLEEALVQPHPIAQLLTLNARITALDEGDYRLRAQLCPASPEEGRDAPPIHECAMQLAAGETRSIQLNLAASLPLFKAGEAYAAPGLKLWLVRQAAAGKWDLCESTTLLCGFSRPAPGSFLPLTADDCKEPPELLVQRLNKLHISCVSLPAAAPDLLYRLLTRAGVAVRQQACTPPDARKRIARYPCVTFEGGFAAQPAPDGDPILSAWQLCGLIPYPRAAVPGLTPADMLHEAAGQALDPVAPAVAEVLAWLRVLSIRLRAEAIRQGKLAGACCAPGEWRQPEAAQALQSTFAPLHLSALPLCGAWWTQSHFSASLHAFVPADAFPTGTALRAQAMLEDAQGTALARSEFPCPARGGALGLLEAVLPDKACVLELITRLYAGEELVEEASMPVYVGMRGALEGAF